jgi:CheY-like chemotaxis protein
MRILIVEDDYIQANALRDALKREIPELKVDRIATESQFRAALPGLARDKPDVILMDVMLRWSDPAPQRPEPPEDVLQEGSRRSGLRCQRRLADNPETRDIPVILYTVLESSDLQLELEDLRGNCVYLPKDSSVAPLVDEIRRRVQPGRLSDPKSESVGPRA